MIIIMITNTSRAADAPQVDEPLLDLLARPKAPGPRWKALT